MPPRVHPWLKNQALARLAAVALALAFYTTGPALAFLPPADTRDGLTLRIEGFAENTAAEKLTTAKHPAEKPFAITVTLENKRPAPVSGPLRVWLNDDWSVSGGAASLFAPAGAAVSATFTVTAGPSVLPALYPVHATFAPAGAAAGELHPVAIFEAVPSGKRSAAPQWVSVPANGLLRLDTLPVRAFLGQKTSIVEMPSNGRHPATGAQAQAVAATRDGVTRAGFSCHPPWRGGPGFVFLHFPVELPTKPAAELRFHTALRVLAPGEPPGDGVRLKVLVTDDAGVPREIFSRLETGRSWNSATVNLAAFAGQKIILSLQTDPGPENNTTNDQVHWGDVVVATTRTPPVPTAAEWRSREKAAAKAARAALKTAPASPSASGQPAAFRLAGRGGDFGAAIIPGRQGLADAVIAFVSPDAELLFRGFAIELDGTPVGADGGLPVDAVETTAADTTSGGGALSLVHRVATAGGSLSLRATIRVVGPALSIAWDIPGARRGPDGHPRFTRLGIGPAFQPVFRAYAGFGNVIEKPGPFSLAPDGFTLSTRHAGADYPNGLSLVQAVDIFPDRLVHAPASLRFALETHHDAAFLLVPSASGAFTAARDYADLAGFKKSPGVDALAGALCLDNWGSVTPETAAGLRLAAAYGLRGSVYVHHVWQRWGYDYRLPEIFPPAAGLEAFLTARRAAAAAGIRFAPHDNYIDFYPDAEGFDYDHIVFTPGGAPLKAWYHKTRRAQSYRWRPGAFLPRLEKNMRLLRGALAPDALFIDVFSAIAPFDFHDRSGAFFPKIKTQAEYRRAFDTARRILGNNAVMISEAGHDALVGSLDAGEADHFPASRWLKNSAFADAERVPWHDIATHGKFILFAGGLGDRYSKKDNDAPPDPARGYGSDDYLTNTVIGGRNPMAGGPFNRVAVMTHWLLADVSAALARATFESHQFAGTIHRQHAVFSNHCLVWTNRGETDWPLPAGVTLPKYGFYAKTPAATAAILLLDGRRAAFAQTPATFFADARPPALLLNPDAPVAAAAVSAQAAADNTLALVLEWDIRRPLPGAVPFRRFCDASGEIRAQADAMPNPLAAAGKTGTVKTTALLKPPPALPDGDYALRFGLYYPESGARVSIAGNLDDTRRVRAGTLRIRRPALEWLPESTAGQPAAAATLTDFGPLATNGAFRLLHDDPREWRLIPLPGSVPFRAELDLAALDAAGKKVLSIENETRDGAPDSAAAPPEWKQTAGVLSLATDARAFALRIRFD